MNICEINFKDKMKKYEVVDEISNTKANRTSKEIVLELSKETRITVNLVSGEGHFLKINFKGNTFFDMLNHYCSDEELDKSILINSEIYLEIKALLKAEAILSNSIIIDTVHFNNIIENITYRMDCFQKISVFISTYDEHPSEDDLTLFLVGTTGRLLAEFLYEKGLAKYSREMNGYLITFDERVNANDRFITDLLDFINRLGIAGTASALDYL
ncbi:hypothetical protein NSS64_15630 [Paenibacillus sp. FSL H8-0122]|uniref:hypothetical protein n=1 Tax=Paenibacillus sp. FSL H8-0122 TaxID=2954510 RepID=UPI0030F5FC8E